MTSGETFFSASEILKLGKIPFVVVSRHLHLCMSILGLDITPLIFIPTSQQPTHTQVFCSIMAMLCYPFTFLPESMILTHFIETKLLKKQNF